MRGVWTVDTARVIWDYLMERIGNPFGVAGLMGNLRAESNLNPRNLQNSFEAKLGYTDETYTAAVDSRAYGGFVFDGAGYGLAQWTYWSRKNRLLTMARERGTSIGDLGTQLEVLWTEIRASPAGLKALKGAQGVREAADVVLTKYERPADQSEAVKIRRAAYGQTYYDMFEGGITVATANERRIKVRDMYRKIIGRNIYSQGLRNYCYTPYKDGKYYSDCSSSVSYAYKQAGEGFGVMRTTDMYASTKFEDVPVVIEKGQIKNPEVLRIGDMLLFAGSDAGRKKWGYVGHVEMVGEISGTKVTLYGHGSGNPKKHDMVSYCKTRYNSKTGNTPLGRKLLIRVRRFIRDDGAQTPAPDTDRTLKRGDTGADVKAMQQALKKAGWSFPRYGCDGDFGAETEANVRGFQRVEGLPVTGVYDAATRAALMARIGAGRVEITGGTVNVRSGPGTNNSVIGVAKKGEKYAYGLSADGWVQIDFKGATGWVSTKYAKITEG